MKNLLKKNVNTFELLNQNKFLITNSLLLKTELANALARKEILTSTINFALSNNSTVVTIHGFTRTNRLLRYKKLLKNNKKSNKLNQKTYKKILPLFAYNFNKFLAQNNIIFNYINLNKKLNKKLLIKNYTKYKHFSFSLFARNLNLFLDFIKVLSLIEKNKIDPSVFLTILGQVFSNISKGKHGKFIFFLTAISSDLIKSKINYISGIKFLINGRLMGKPRANTTKIRKGSTELNTISSNCVYKKLHVYTLYGAFGFKLWINYKKKTNTKKIKNKIKKYVIRTKKYKIQKTKKRKKL